MNKNKKKIDFLKDFKRLNPKPVKLKKTLRREDS